MRRSWFMPLMAATLAVSFQAHAAANVSAVAVNKSGQAITLNGMTLVVKAKPAGTPVQAKVTCVVTVDYSTFIDAPPLDDVTFPEKRLFVSAKAGAKWFYVNLFSIAAPGAKPAQAVVAMGVGMSNTGGWCGSNGVTTTDAAGLAVYR